MLVIEVDRNLFDPIFAYTESHSYELITSLKNWFTITSHQNQLVQPFLENQVQKQYKMELEQLKLEIEKLKARTLRPIPQKEKQVTTSTKKPVSGTTMVHYEIAIAIRALFNQTKKGLKRKSSLPKHVEKQLPKSINNFETVYSEVIEQMIQRGFIENKPSSFSTTNAWDEESLDEFCREMNE